MAMRPGESVAQYNARMQEETHAAWRRAVPPLGSGKMPHVSEMIVSKYISHVDVDPPIPVTINRLTKENVGRKDEPEERWVMWFRELKKGMRLNVTTIRILEAAYGQDADRWIGHRIQLYWDPSVQFGGKLVGGVRVRLPKAATGVPGAPAVPPGARFDPMTGAPLAAPAPAQPRFDSMTGLPLTGTVATVNTATGEITTVAPAGIDPEFDDDIPF